MYSFRRCPYAMRARLALAVSGVHCEVREVVLRSKPAEMLAVSHKATVPVLVLASGEVIDESLDIMLWALRHHDPEQWLAPPQTPLQDMLALVAANDLTFKHDLDRYKYPNRYLMASPSPSALDLTAFAQTHRAAGAKWLRQLEAMLTAQNLFGASASLADAAVLPFVRQFAHTDAAWFAEQPWPRLRAWLARFEASDLYRTVMVKHLTWVSTV